MTEYSLSRRDVLAAMVASGAARCVRAQDNEATPRFQICAFIKFVQALSHADLAATMAELGFYGIEATVRRRGYILPKNAEAELPRLSEELEKHDVKIGIMASDVNEANPENEKLLKVARSVGITQYRLGYLRYDLEKPIAPQLASHRHRLLELADLNRQIGIQGIYQNHAGAGTFGSAVWDLVHALDGIDRDHLAVAFDIRHATVEGGQNWSLHFRRAEPHLGAVYVKDFQWDDGESRPRNCPLGKGRVSASFFELLRQSYRGLMSLHVEYLPDGSVKENVAALAADLAKLRQLLAFGE